MSSQTNGSRRPPRANRHTGPPRPWTRRRPQCAIQRDERDEGDASETARPNRNGSSERPTMRKQRSRPTDLPVPRRQPSWFEGAVK